MSANRSSLIKMDDALKRYKNRLGACTHYPVIERFKVIEGELYVEVSRYLDEYGESPEDFRLLN